MCSCACVRVHVCARVRTCACVRVHVRARVCMCVCACVRVRLCMCAHARLRASCLFCFAGGRPAVPAPFAETTTLPPWCRLCSCVKDRSAAFPGSRFRAPDPRPAFCRRRRGDVRLAASVRVGCRQPCTCVLLRHVALAVRGLRLQVNFSIAFDSVETCRLAAGTALSLQVKSGRRNIRP